MLSPLPHAARLSSQFFHLIEFAGVALGALGGAMVVRRDHLYRYDFIGILGLGLISGVGGGIARDILLGDGPPLALLNPIYLALSIGGAGLALFFSKNVGKHLLTLMHIIDAAGLGLFTIAGATRAQNYGLGFLPCLLLGVTTAVGGGSRSHVWLKMIANVLNIPIDIPAEGDFGGAFGAARLGLIAAEGADPIAICKPPKVQETIQPERGPVDAYRAAFQRYRALYPAIKEALKQ